MRARVATMHGVEAALKANVAELMAQSNALRGQIEAFRGEAEARQRMASELLTQRVRAEMKAGADREKSQGDGTRTEILELAEQLTQVQQAIINQKLSETHQLNELQKMLEIVKALEHQKLADSLKALEQR